ncbi:MAG: hypothetical protein ACTHN0_04755 [Aquihabitans sp.]
MDDEGNEQAPGPERHPPLPPLPPAGDPALPPHQPPPGFAGPPTFEPAPGFGAQPAHPTPPSPPGPGDALGSLPPPAPPIEPVAPGWKRLIAPTEPVDGPRPAPTVTSMVAVGGGLLAATGLFALLGELDGYDQRATGLAISLLFVALGVAISVLNRSSRAAAGGVALSIIGVIPFTGYVFANADLFDLFSGASTSDADPWQGIRWTVTLMLATAAALWLVGYLFVPTRRYGAYLGAALIALWLIPLFNLQLSAAQDALGRFGSVTTFEPVPDSGFSSDFDSGFDDPSLDDFDSQFGEPLTLEQPRIADPSTKMGLASLAIGAVYLALAAWRDRKGDARMATAALAPAVIVLLYANSLLVGHIGWVGSGLLAMAVGGLILAVGVRGERRASSWIGLLLATVGLGSMVFQALDESPRAIGAVLTVLGVGIALITGRRDALRSRTSLTADVDPPAPSDGFGPPPGPPPTPPSSWSQTF